MQKSPLPVFIISYNRGHLVKRLIESMEHLSTEFDFVVHDNGSDDHATLEILEDLRKKKAIKLRKNSKIYTAKQLNQVNQTVQKYFEETKTTAKYYAVTDCDLDFSKTKQNAIAIYAALLNHFKSAQCVGPMLTIEDIPKEYPLYNHVMNRHISQFWRKKPIILNTNLGPVAFQRAVIDTTFAVHRRNDLFRRLKIGLRVYNPYEVKHVDWYRYNSHYYPRQTDVSHWGNPEYNARYCSSELKYDTFYVVERSSNGSELRCTKRNL